MMMGTYEIRNKLNGMPYGGSSGVIEQRWKDHRWALRGDRHHCEHLQRAWNKYGEDAFEFIILEIIEDPVERIAAEQKWLDEHWPNCYNTARDAIMPMEGRKHTPATKLKMGVAATGNQNAKGFKHTEATCRKLSEANKGKKLTEGHKRKIGDANRGQKRTAEQNRRNSIARMGNQNARGNRSMSGQKHTDAAKQKMAVSKAKPYSAFIHRDTGEIIPAGVNLNLLCRGRGLHSGCMHRVKNGKQSHHKGWMLLVGNGGNPT